MFIVLLDITALVEARNTCDSIYKSVYLDLIWLVLVLGLGLGLGLKLWLVLGFCRGVDIKLGLGLVLRVELGCGHEPRARVRVRHYSCTFKGLHKIQTVWSEVKMRQ